MKIIHTIERIGFAPSSQITEPETIHRARSLSALLFVVMPLGAVLLGQHLVRNSPALSATDIAVQLISYSVLIGCYLLSRTRHFKATLFLFCTIILLGTWASVGAAQGPTEASGIMLGTAAAVLLVSCFSSARMTALVALLNGTIGVMVIQTQSKLAMADMIPTLVALGYLSALSVFAVIVHRRDTIIMNKQELALTQNIERQEIVIESLCEGVWELNLESGVSSYSQQWKDLRGMSGEEDTGMIEFWWRSILPEDIERVQTEITAGLAESRPKLEFSFRIKPESSEIRHMRAHARVIYSETGEPLRLIGAELDETEVVEFRRHLTGMVKDKTEALAESLAAERKLREGQIGFLANASHELRTPMSAILAASDILRKYRSRMKPEEINQRFERITEQVRVMTSLLDDMSDLNRMHRGGLTLKTVNLSELCTDMLKGFAPSGENEVTFDSDVDPAKLLVRLDRTLMEKAINAILDNAVKYSPDKSKIKMSLTHDEESLTLEVSDQGVGIPDEELEFVFQPFFRGRDITQVDGTGLGLTLVYDAITLHHGRVAIRSELGVGTTVCLVLPCIPNSPKENSAAAIK
jgi:signal transduction histidine kinase